MSVLTVTNLSHGFGDRVIFEDVSFRVLHGEKIGIVGANGEGKSTFMGIITKKLTPDLGKIEWAKNVRVGYMDQHADLTPGITIREEMRQAFRDLLQLEQDLLTKYEQMGDADEATLNQLMDEAADMQSILDNSDFYLIDAKIDEIARGLGIFELGLERRVDDLSGGQRSKILIAKLLLEKPDMLLLDEPTNHLDEEHIAWLKDYLLAYEKAFILISHDMSFLNDVVNLVYHVEHAQINRYVGDYNEFLRVYEQKKRQLEAAYTKQQQEIASLKDFVARNKANAATAGMASSRQKKLDKMDLIELAGEKPKPIFSFLPGKTPEKLIFETQDLVIGYSRPLTKPINLTLERGQKIAIVGANGLGKTTLLRSLLGEIKSLSGTTERGRNQELGYFEQEPAESSTHTCIDEIWEAFPAMTQYEVRSALAKCGLTTKHIESRVHVLSGGERAKVRLCKILNRPSNLLILDEPTNHLDVDAKDELKKALKAYKGTILMVCHEPEFYQDIVTDVWNLEHYLVTA